MIVAKFGGSSLADAACYQRAAGLVLAQPAIRLVVVSASAKTTDAILALTEHAASGAAAATAGGLAQMRTHHLGMAAELALNAAQTQALHEQLEQLARQLRSGSAQGFSAAWRDACLGQGEALSSQLFVAALGQRGQAAAAFDARRVLRTDANFGAARPQRGVIRQLVQQELLPLLHGPVVQVTQGFVGATAAGQPTCLGRGGSDYTAALFAEASAALVLQIWTDVPGIASADPRWLPQARYLPACSYHFAETLAAAGGKVLHPDTVEPARAARIPIWVGSSLEPQAAGTWIRGGQSHDNQALAVRELAVLVRRPQAAAQTYGVGQRLLRDAHADYVEYPDHAALPQEDRGVQVLPGAWALLSLLSRRALAKQAVHTLAQRHGWVCGEALSGLGQAVLVPRSALRASLEELHRQCIEASAPVAPVLPTVELESALLERPARGSRHTEQRRWA